MTQFPSAVRQKNAGSHESGVGGGRYPGRAAVPLILIPSGTRRAFCATHGVWLPRSNASKHEKYEALAAGTAGGVLGGHNAMSLEAAMERLREENRSRTVRYKPKPLALPGDAEKARMTDARGARRLL